MGLARKNVRFLVEDKSTTKREEKMLGAPTASRGLYFNYDLSANKSEPKNAQTSPQNPYQQPNSMKEAI